MGGAYNTYGEFILAGEYRCVIIVTIHFLGVNNNFCFFLCVLLSKERADNDEGRVVNCIE
jgi:hypothetical protein